MSYFRRHLALLNQMNNEYILNPILIYSTIKLEQRIDK